MKGVARPVEEVDAVAALRSARLDPCQSGAKPWLLRIDPTSVTGRRVHVEADGK